MKRKLVTVVAVVVAALALVAPAGATVDQWVLPAPTGRHAVGWTQQHLVDEDRTDPWVPTGPRELMVSVWYPATAPRGDRVPYATAEESRLLLELYGITSAPPDALTRVRTNARAGAPRLPGRFPLVVLSPGFVFTRWTLTTLAEDLASRGYVVVGVDHTYESAAVTFPGDRVVACTMCNGGASGPAVTASRALDISFVLDEVLSRYRKMINPHRIAVAGHSMGGMAAAATMLVDPRVDAGVNMDGSFRSWLPQDLPRPFMMLGAENGGAGDRPAWDEAWTHLTGWRRWIQVPQVSHVAVSDAALLVEWLGLPPGALPGTRTIEILRGYVGAFTDLHLRHRPQPLLDGPSPSFPEVHFVGPA